MDHPLNSILWLLLAGLSALFVGLVIAFYYSAALQDQPIVELPSIFYFNTLVLIGSSLLIEYARKQYDRQEFSRYYYSLYGVLVLTLIFLSGQFIGWDRLIENQVSLKGSQVGAYLYLISGLHFLHVIFGLPFLLIYIFRIRAYTGEAHRRSIHMADPGKRRALVYLCRYWHFLDLLWIFLLIAFTIQRIIL